MAVDDDGDGELLHRRGIVARAFRVPLPPRDLGHNRRVRRLLATCLLVVFAFLATGDTFVCPDGCSWAESRAAAARCDASGACVFCTAAAVIPVSELALVRFVPTDIVADHLLLAIPLPPAPPPDHPPRLA